MRGTVYTPTQALGGTRQTRLVPPTRPRLHSPAQECLVNTRNLFQSGDRNNTAVFCSTPRDFTRIVLTLYHSSDSYFPRLLPRYSSIYPSVRPSVDRGKKPAIGRSVGRPALVRVLYFRFRLTRRPERRFCPLYMLREIRPRLRRRGAGGLGEAAAAAGKEAFRPVGSLRASAEPED